MLLTGSGSPPISARPMRLKVYSTSGNAISFSSKIGATCKAVSKLDDGANVARRLMVPSSSSGTNSVPICGTNAIAVSNKITEEAITNLVRFIAIAKLLRYHLSNGRKIILSRSVTPLVNKYVAIAGTTIKATKMAEITAKIILIAIG